MNRGYVQISYVRSSYLKRDKKRTCDTFYRKLSTFISRATSPKQCRKLFGLLFTMEFKFIHSTAKAIHNRIIKLLKLFH